MRVKRTEFPPNCETRDSNPSRLRIFLEKQAAVFREYGFLLCVKCRTPQEREGHRRYQRDVQRQYRKEHSEELRAYRHQYWEKVQKRKLESKLQTDGRDAEWREKKEKRRKQREFDRRKQQVFEEYGFYLRIPPKTPEERAGRDRYRREMQKRRREENREIMAERQKAWNAARREKNERLFQEKMRELEKTDPAAAAKKRLIHEKARWIQGMSHEDRVRYRQQKLYEKLKAQAERERVLEARRKAKAKRMAAMARSAEKNREQNAKRLAELARKRARAERIERKKKEKAEKSRRWREFVAENAARREAERALEEKYRKEREENLRRYLEARQGRFGEREGSEA